MIGRNTVLKVGPGLKVSFLRSPAEPFAIAANPSKLVFCLRIPLLGTRPPNSLSARTIREMLKAFSDAPLWVSPDRISEGFYSSLEVWKYENVRIVEYKLYGSDQLLTNRRIKTHRTATSSCNPSKRPMLRTGYSGKGNSQPIQAQAREGSC